MNTRCISLDLGSVPRIGYMTVAECLKSLSCTAVRGHDDFYGGVCPPADIDTLQVQCPRVCDIAYLLLKATHIATSVIFHPLLSI